MTGLEDLKLVSRRPCDVCEGSGHGERAFEYPAGHAVRRSCGNCDGRGHVDVEIPVGDLADHILARVRQPAVAEEDLAGVLTDLKSVLARATLKAQGKPDPAETSAWLRAAQEAAEALRSVGELRPQPREH